MNFISGEDFIFNIDTNNNIHTGGFSVNSILMKGGFSPIITLNNDNIQTGGHKNVSDIFNSLVVPNWALSYNNKIAGDTYDDSSDFEDSDDDSVNEQDGGNKIVSEDIHDRLVKLISELDNTSKQKKKNITKKMLKLKKTKTKKNKK